MLQKTGFTPRASHQFLYQLQPARQKAGGVQCTPEPACTQGTCKTPRGFIPVPGSWTVTISNGPQPLEQNYCIFRAENKSSKNESEYFAGVKGKKNKSRFRLWVCLQPAWEQGWKKEAPRGHPAFAEVVRRRWPGRAHSPVVPSQQQGDCPTDGIVPSPSPMAQGNAPHGLEEGRDGEDEPTATEEPSGRALLLPLPSLTQSH